MFPSPSSPREPAPPGHPSRAGPDRVGGARRWVLAGLLSACTAGKSPDSAPVVSGHEPPTARRWGSVAAGCYFTCGVDERGRASCWGRESVDVRDTGGGARYATAVLDEIPDLGFASIALVSPGVEPCDCHACGVLLDGGAVCWGGGVEDGVGQPPAGAYVSVDVTELYSLGLQADGAILLWSGGQPPPEGRYTAVSASYEFGLAIREDGDIVRWNLPGTNPPLAPEAVFEGTYTRVSAGVRACAIDSVGGLHCWSSEGPYYPDGFPTGSVVDVCVSGEDWGCALGTDGHASCFSDYPDYLETMSAIPDEVFTQITCGSLHACGVTPDHRIVCWGDLSHGEGTPPA